MEPVHVFPPEQIPLVETRTLPAPLPAPDGKADADVATLPAAEEAAVPVGMMTMEIGVVLEEATDAGADDALSSVADVALAAVADDALAAVADDALTDEELESPPLELPEVDPDPDDATPLTGPQVPVKLPESEELRVTSASGPGSG